MIPRVFNYCETCKATKGIAKDAMKRGENQPGPPCPTCGAETKIIADKLTKGQFYRFMLGMGLVLQAMINNVLGTFSYAPTQWVAWYNLLGSIIGLVLVVIGILILFSVYRTSFKHINWDLSSETIPLDYNNQFMKAIMMAVIIGLILSFLFMGIPSGLGYLLASIIPMP